VPLWLWIVISLIGLAVIYDLIEWGIKRYRFSKLPPAEQLEIHVEANTEYMESIRNSLTQRSNHAANKLSHDFKSELLGIIDNFQKVSTLVIEKNPKTIEPILRLCNHRNFMLATKTEMSEVDPKNWTVA
jgi:hypothetical protein